MNSLGLRGTGNAKIKRKVSGAKDMAVVIIPPEMIGETLQKHYAIFSKAQTGDEQFKYLSNFLKSFRNNPNSTELDGCYSYFLALIWFYSNSSHPYKPYLSRYLMKHEKIQTFFIDSLKKIFSMEVMCIEQRSHRFYNVVSNVISCTESAITKRTLGLITPVLLELVTYSISFCCTRLKKQLSPTEKSYMYQLSHITVRASLHVIQNPGTMSSTDIVLKTRQLVNKLVSLMADPDVPMDNKTVGGILFLHLYVMEFGESSWLHILDHEEMSVKLENLMNNQFTRLVMYSSITAVVDHKSLIKAAIGDDPVILLLAKKITACGDRYIQEPTFALCVTRTVVQLCQVLHKIEDSELSLKLAELIQAYTWTHIDSHLDSVRYLATEALSHLVKHSACLYKKDDTLALSKLLLAIFSLTNTRKAYFLSLTEVVRAVGAKFILQKMPDIVAELIDSLNVQEVKTSASTTLEAILDNDRDESHEDMYQKWIVPIMGHIDSKELDSSVLKILGNLIAKILKRDNNIVAYILQEMLSTNSITSDIILTDGQLKCVLVLLGVARKVSAICDAEVTFDRKEWKQLIQYKVLKDAAIHSSDEIRLLSLSLVVETPKTTELIVEEDYNFMIHFLKYNMNTQSPVYRQQMLAALKKFMKRVEDTYKLLARTDNKIPNHEQFKKGVESFIEELRSLCSDCLVVGANYSRRTVALQAMLSTQLIMLQDYERTWKSDYVQQLLLHLDDSYENNKSTALQILSHCPAELLKEERFANTLNFKAILKQATSIKPTDCVSAAYKLKLLKMKLPENISNDIRYSGIAEPVTYHLIQILLKQLSKEVDVAKISILLAASSASMFGTVHCICQLIMGLDYAAISADEKWTNLVGKLLQASFNIIKIVSPVVNSSSPEGHLPMDFNAGVQYFQQSTNANTNKMTSQRVLLCAWRSVKEVSLLLAEIVSSFVILEESFMSRFGNITQADVMTIGNIYTTLLTETKHRGAFEQAYVGYTKLLHRLWRSPYLYLQNVPKIWLDGLMSSIFIQKNPLLCGTRRSAGLPFMIQALATVEVQVSTNPIFFDHCMSTLLSVADTSPPATEHDIDNSIHSMNILRTLFTNSAIANAVTKFVGSGMMIAIKGFLKSTWGERNSAQLLLSALMVRVFGVPRSREQDAFSIRNKMTGRIFFLKYPDMYDFMLTELTAASFFNAKAGIRASLFPVLLILARLYPSSLEGTTTNLKLAEFIPVVSRCANCPILLVRRLSAAAIVPLIPQQRYTTFIRETFNALCRPNCTMNYYHGTMMQLVKLMEGLSTHSLEDTTNCDSLLGSLTWVMHEFGSHKCYVLIDEYLKLVNLCLWRYPQYSHEETWKYIEQNLNIILFLENLQSNPPGRDVCLANSIYVYLIILKKNETTRMDDVIINTLAHDKYELVSNVLSLILILYNKYEEPMNNYEKHWQEINSDKTLLKALSSNKKYIKTLCKLLKHKYLNCVQKVLKILSLEENTQAKIIETKYGKTNLSDREIVECLIGCVENEHETLTATYLCSLLKFVSSKMGSDGIANENVFVNVLRTMFDCSRPDNSERVRHTVVSFIQDTFMDIYKYEYKYLDYQIKFEVKTTLWAILAVLLEDDSEDIRNKMAAIVVLLSDAGSGQMTPSICGEVLVDTIRDVGDKDSIATLLLLALIDFGTEVCLGDADNDIGEGRVFDHNEKYNVFMEESILSIRCIKKIIEMHTSLNIQLRDVVLLTLNDRALRDTFVRLCGENLKVFETLLSGEQVSKDIVYNPKVDVVFAMIR